MATTCGISDLLIIVYRDNFDAMFELVDSIKKKYARNIRDFTEALTDNTSLQFSCFKIAK
jgi:hypothetical protein